MPRRHQYLHAFHEVLPAQLFQFGWIGEWRQGVKRHHITVIVDLDGQIPSPLPPLRSFLCWPIHVAIPHLPIALDLAHLIAVMIQSGERVGIACLAGEQRSLWMAGLVLWQLGYGNGPKILDMLHAANPDGPGNPFSSHILSLRKNRVSLAT